MTDQEKYIASLLEERDYLQSVADDREKEMWKAVGEVEKLRAMCDEFDTEARKLCISSCDQYSDCKSENFVCDHAGLRRVIEQYSEMTTDEDN